MHLRCHHRAEAVLNTSTKQERIVYDMHLLLRNFAIISFHSKAETADSFSCVQFEHFVSSQLDTSFRSRSQRFGTDAMLANATAVNILGQKQHRYCWFVADLHFTVYRRCNGTTGATWTYLTSRFKAFG